MDRFRRVGLAAVLSATRLAAAAASVAACAPRYAALGPIAPTDLWTPLPVQHVTVDGVDVAYVDSGGAGTPVVLIHGLSSTIGFWEHQIAALAQNHRVLALDLPGFGASARPDAPYDPPWYAGVVAGWMDAVGVPSAAVVGHSMGGQVAITLALDHPQRVDALVLSAPAGIETFDPGAASVLKRYYTENRAYDTTEDELRYAFCGLAFGRVDDGVERLLMERVRMRGTPALRGTSVAVSRAIAGMLDHPVRDRLDQIAAPTLVVFGTDDRMIPNPLLNGGRTTTVAREAERAIPGAKLVLIQRGGHTVHHDAPDVFNRAVETFLSEAR
ncbi:MAG: alpha/beta fold hydrolase [Myxococcota bacterium]